MGEIAFVFSGQGDQFCGMGKDLYEKYSAAKAVFDICDSIRPETSSQCFNSSEDELKMTKNTQPCLFAYEYAAASVLTENGILPAAVAGFSLGEVAAAAYAGVFDLETGFRAVCKRGELMQKEAMKHETFMAAVLKLSAETVEELCLRFSQIYPVNFNCPGQTTVSGLADNMQEFLSAVKEAGGRAVPLKVKGAFHSPFMKDASAAFKKELEKYDIKKPSIPLYSNITACEYDRSAVELLSRQISSSVKWESIIRNMIASGIDTIIEIGPGNTLSNMAKRTDANLTVYSTACIEDILSEVKPC